MKAEDREGMKQWLNALVDDVFDQLNEDKVEVIAVAGTLSEACGRVLRVSMGIWTLLCASNAKIFVKQPSSPSSKLLAVSSLLWIPRRACAGCSCVHKINSRRTVSNFFQNQQSNLP